MKPFSIISIASAQDHLYMWNCICVCVMCTGYKRKTEENDIIQFPYKSYLSSNGNLLIEICTEAWDKNVKLVERKEQEEYWSN